MFCKSCGKPVGEDEKFCAHCGHDVQTTRVSGEVAETNQKKVFSEEYRLRNLDVPAAEKHIKNAWIAALISAGFTAAFIIFDVLDAWSWLDVGLIVLFALGLYRKNKIAAIGMFMYFVISKIIQIGQAENFSVSAVLVATAFLVYFYLGMMATIRYQQLMPKEHRRRGVVFGIVVGALATLSVVILLIGLLPEDPTPEDVVLKADYQEGYKAGYVDGRAAEATIGDSYIQIATEERREAYNRGYLAGFMNGCNEGGFDCREAEQAINEAFGEEASSSDGEVQLIPKSI